MSEIGGNTENIHTQSQVIDLKRENSELVGWPLIRVATNILGVSVWDEMLLKSQETGIEFGIVVSTNGNEILTSRIFEGIGERNNYDGTSNYPPSFTPPFLPHGVRSLSPRVKDRVLVHVHPIPAAIDHLPTTVMSETDIQAYENSNYNALVMIDIGGVHMLTGRHPHRNTERIPVQKIVANAFKISKGNTNTIEEVRIETAKSLRPFGIRYYFSPNKTPSKDGYLLLSDSANVNKIA